MGHEPQSEGRKENAAQPASDANSKTTPQAYPPARKDDSIEPAGEGRSFDPAKNPAPRRGAGDTTASSLNEGRMGPGGDPAEGKR